jgi:hypothetical protein
MRQLLYYEQNHITENILSADSAADSAAVDYADFSSYSR